MDNSLITVLISIGVTLLLLLLFRQNRGGGNSGELDSKQIIDLINTSLDKLNKDTQNINANTSEQNQKIEQKFGEIQLKINELLSGELNKIQELQTNATTKTVEQFTDLSQKQQQKFGEIQTQNLTSLAKIQQYIQERIDNGLKNISQSNQKSFEQLSQTNDKRLHEIQGKVEDKMDKQLQKHLESFDAVKKNLTQIQGSAERMIESTKSVDKLNSIFERTASKSFGDFGEKFLEKYLEENLLPGTWDRQFNIDGNVIDFVIHLNERIIGIDSKFPLTRYQDYINSEIETKKLKKQLFLKQVTDMARSIKSKYSKHKKIDQLVMYLPSDGIYLEIVNDKNTLEVLNKTGVTLSSPNIIAPLILTIRDYQIKANINNNAESIIDGLKVIGKNVDSFQNEFKKLGDKLRQAQGNYDVANRSLTSISNEVKLLETSE